MRLFSDLIKDSLDMPKLLTSNWHNGTTIDILRKYSNNPGNKCDTLNDYEMVLRKELDEERNQLYTDTLDFSEKEYVHRDHHVDYINSLCPDIFPSKKNICVKSNVSYEACHFDILTDCKLVLKFKDIDMKKNIVDILEHINVEFIVFGTVLSNLSLLHHIMMSMLHGHDYDSDGDDFIVPLYAPFVKDNNKDKLLKAMSTIQIKIRNVYDYVQTYYVSEGYYINYRNNDIIAKQIPFYSVNSSIYMNIDKPFQIRLKNYTKIMFFNLVTYNEHENIEDVEDVTPNISAIYFSLNGYQPVIFTEETLMHVNIMGKKVYLISICPELRSLYDIESHFKSDSINNYGISIPSSYNTIIWFESDSDLSRYSCEIQIIKPDKMDILIPWEYSL